jgi:hypothetical protein
MVLFHQFARPGNCQKKRAVFERLDVVPNALVEREQATHWQIEGSTSGTDLDVTADRLDRNPALCLVIWYTSARFHCDQYDPQVVVLHEGLGVVAGLPLWFPMEQLELRAEVELDVDCRHRVRIRPAVCWFGVRSL